MSVNSTEVQASGESEISRSSPHNSNPSVHEPTARSHSPTLSHLSLRSMSAASPPAPETSAKPVRPTFQPSDQDFPTRDELVEYAAHVDAFGMAMRYMLTYLQVDEATWPPAPNTTIPATLMQDAAIWRRASEIGEAIAQIESFLKDAQINTTEQEKEQLCQNSVGVTSGPSNSIKTPLPSKYNGKKGDPAFTFIAACNNYRVMKPGAFQNNT